MMTAVDLIYALQRSPLQGSPLQRSPLLLEDAPKLDEATRNVVKQAIRERAVPKRPDLYGVVLHNDDINTMEFVIRVIREVFGYRRSKASRLMLTAHFAGKCVLWIGPRREALEKAEQMIGYGPDPSRADRGAAPLRVTIEPAPSD